MRKLLVALVALTAAAALVLIGLPALAAGPRSFTAHSKTVRAGQRVKVSGKGCGSQAFVRFYLNDIEIDDDRADRAGQFVDNVEIPTSMDLGEAEVKAGCSGYRVGTATITVLGSRFDVEPRRVEAGELVTVSGSLCKPRSYVTVKLNGRLIGDGRATSRGQFRIRVRIPSDAEDSVQVSARTASPPSTPGARGALRSAAASAVLCWVRGEQQLDDPFAEPVTLPARFAR